MQNTISLETHFAPFRRGIIGVDQEVALSDGRSVPLIYADWIASGRLYDPIEQYLQKAVGPWVANTHTESTLTGATMTRAYRQARDTIKGHVGANEEDCLFLAGFGMTAAINKLQRILGLRLPEGAVRAAGADRPLVVITHMEHHSNQITWEECDVDTVILPRDDKTGLSDLAALQDILDTHRERKLKIGAFTAGSNVTGILTPVHTMARMLHRAGGYCFVDYAAAAPYVDICMHPSDPEERLDAVAFSPHKFLGGPGGPGVLLLNRALYHRRIPDTPGGGTVLWTTPFGTHRYLDEIELREDGGTPGFLQAIRAALAIRVKEAMGPVHMLAREKELMELLLKKLRGESQVYLLEPQNMDRLGILSFYAPGEHHNLIVRLLNDRFGIQVRGGCSCAGTYGHVLFNIDQGGSGRITDMIDQGDLTEKPGWIRISLHPTMTNAEVERIGQAVCETIRHYADWQKDYVFHPETGDFTHQSAPDCTPDLLSGFRAEG